MAAWKGEYPAQFVGGDTTSIDSVTFRTLAERIIGEGFFEWEEEQDAHITDVPSLSIAVTLVDGRTKRVTGTGTLHMGLGLALDSTAQTLQWRREVRPFEFYHRLSTSRGASTSTHKS